MKKRLASMSKDRPNESISMIYARREHNPDDRLDQIGVRPKNFYEDRTDLHEIESIQGEAELSKHFKSVNQTPNGRMPEHQSFSTTDMFKHRNSQPACSIKTSTARL